MITNRSNHIPMFTTIEIMNENAILVLNFLDHYLDEDEELLFTEVVDSL